MISSKLFSAIASFVVFLACLPSPAMETDQFNLPPVPLADIAPEVEAYVAQNIQAAIDKLNGQIANSERCLGGHQYPSAGFGTREASTSIIEAPSPRPRDDFDWTLPVNCSAKGKE